MTHVVQEVPAPLQTLPVLTILLLFLLNICTQRDVPLGMTAYSRMKLQVLSTKKKKKETTKKNQTTNEQKLYLMSALCLY